MTYASHTRQTSEPLKRLAHARRFAQAVPLLDVTSADRVLDYGCGDGHLFTQLGDVPHAQMVGFDPSTDQLAEVDPSLRDATFYDDRRPLLARHRGQFTRIACWEVCEHLPPETLSTALRDLADLAAPGALVVFGVPIETGLPGFFKQTYRLVMAKLTGAAWRSHGARWSSAWRMLVGAKVPRARAIPGVDYYFPHAGFRHRDFARALRQHGYRIERTHCLPFPALGAVLNNEIYYVCSIPSAPTARHTASMPPCAKSSRA